MDISVAQSLESVDNDADALDIVKSNLEANIIKAKGVSDSRITKLYGMSDKWYIQRMLNPAAQYKYAYLLLDTNNKADDLSSSTQFGWRILNYISQQTGTVNVAQNIRDVVGMRIFPVSMLLDSPIGEAGKTYVNNITNTNNNFTLLIHEFQAQSFVGRDGRKFHFSLFPTNMNVAYPTKGPGYASANPYYECDTTDKSSGWFWFRTPITEFSTMTISIGNPFDLVPLTDRILIPLQLVYLAEKSEA